MIGSHNNRQAINHLKFFGFVIALCFFFAGALTSYAQERSGFGADENLKGQDELNPHMDGHVNTPANAAATREKEIYRDTTSVKPVVGVRNKPDSSAQKKTEDETLSFNFLYFIIQKFKVSDMMN